MKTWLIEACVVVIAVLAGIAAVALALIAMHMILKVS